MLLIAVSLASSFICFPLPLAMLTVLWEEDRMAGAWCRPYLVLFRGDTADYSFPFLCWKRSPILSSPALLTCDVHPPKPPTPPHHLGRLTGWRRSQADIYTIKSLCLDLLIKPMGWCVCWRRRRAGCHLPSFYPQHALGEDLHYTVPMCVSHFYS